MALSGLNRSARTAGQGKVVDLEEEFRGSPSEARALLVLGPLQEWTGWELHDLVERLECSVSLGEEEKDLANLERSIEFMSWVLDLVRRVDSSAEMQRNRRAVVDGARSLLARAGGKPEDRLIRCRRAVVRSPHQAYSAEELFSFGEIAEGWSQAARALPDGPAREDQDIQDAHAADFDVGDVSLTNLEIAFSGDDELIRNAIGPEAAANIRAHAADCHRCQEIAISEWAIDFGARTVVALK